MSVKPSRFLISLICVVALIQPVFLGLAPTPSYSLQQTPITKINERLPVLERMEEPQSLPDTSTPDVSLSAEMPAELDTPTRQTDDWTVMVFICADNNLEEAGFDDINAMETIGSTADVNIIVAVDFSASYSGAPFTGGKIYYIDYDTGGSIASTELYSWPSEPNFGDPATLIYFVNYAQTNYPANNYALVLWDHGGGWAGVCFDDNPSAGISMSELSTALGDGSLLDIDLLAFDACLMGQAEVAYQVRDHCDFAVFSEENIPFQGFPYEYWLDDLTTTPSMSPATLASTMVDRYCEAYDTGGIYASVGADQVCLSAVQTSQISGVSGALNTFTDALDSTSVARTHYSSLSYAIGNTYTFGYPLYIDLGIFASQAAASITDATIAGYASSLASAVTTAVSAEEHLSGAGSLTGLSIALEDYGSSSIALATDTRYDEFLDIFCSIGASSSSCLTPVAGYTYGFLDWPGDSVYYKFVPGASGYYSFSLSAMQDLNEDYDLYLYRGSTEIDSSTSYDSTETVSGTLTGGTTYYVEVYCYSQCGAFRLNIPAGGTGGTTGGGGTPPGIPLLLIIALIAIVVVIVIIVVVVVVVRRRRARDVYGTTSTSSVRAVSSPTGRVRCQHCFSIVPSDSTFCPICGNRV